MAVPFVVVVNELPVGSLLTEPTPLPDQGSSRARRLLPSGFGTLLAIAAMAYRSPPRRLITVQKDALDQPGF
jgi:hypothetical protein